MRVGFLNAMSILYFTYYIHGNFIVRVALNLGSTNCITLHTDEIFISEV